MPKKIKDNVKSSEALFNPKLNVEAYNAVAKHSRLSMIQLIENELKVLPSFFTQKNDVSLELNHQVCSLSISRNEQVVYGMFHYEVIGKSNRKHLLKAKSDFLVVYEIADDAEENEAKAFCARVGLFAAYPYFRATFAQQCAFANLELPTLPVLSADPLKQLSGGQRAVIASSPESSD